MSMPGRWMSPIIPSYGYSRLTAGGDVVYFAWHETKLVDRYSLSAGDLGPVELETFEEPFVQGIDVTPDGWLVINGGVSGDMLHVFDAETGTALFDVAAGASGITSGLHCEVVVPL